LEKCDDTAATRIRLVLRKSFSLVDHYLRATSISDASHLSPDISDLSDPSICFSSVDRSRPEVRIGDAMISVECS
jgi:hypothetical protein